ncbi:MAG: hypothetical protein AB1411_16960, partial [Nitrospirota bacterium]
MIASTSRPSLRLRAHADIHVQFSKRPANGEDGIIHSLARKHHSKAGRLQEVSQNDLRLPDGSYPVASVNRKENEQLQRVGMENEVNERTSNLLWDAGLHFDRHSTGDRAVDSRCPSARTEAIGDRWPIGSEERPRSQLEQSLSKFVEEKLSNVVDRPRELGGGLVHLSLGGFRFLLHAVDEAHAGPHEG